VATLTLDNPKRHNAFDDTLIARLTEALAGFGADPAVRVVVLASTGPSFSAGADLGWMQRMAGYSEAENLADAAALAGMMRTLDRLGKPTIALVQGPAYGGGVGLLACCDIVLAAESAKFCLSEVKLGLIPAAISPFVVSAIGARQARRYFITAEVFTAQRAHEIGLVHEVVAPDELETARDRVIAALLQGGPQAQAEAKSLVFLCEGARLDDELSAETGRRIARRRASEEGREGVGAFLQRRPPAWVPTPETTA
jgi:methylglutaconyl-CoA hydratase